MMELILIANYTLERVAVSRDHFLQVKDKAYLPLLNMFEEFSLPVVHCLSAYAMSLFREYHAEDFVERLKIVANVGRAEIASKGFSDAAFASLPERDIRQQLSRAQEIETELWGVSTGFRPAEGWLDPFMVTVLKEMGFNWTIISGACLSNLYGQEPALQLQLLKQKGMEEQAIDVLCAYDDANRTFSQNLKNVFTGQCNVKQFITEISKTIESQKKYHPIMLLDFDMESPYFSDNPSGAVQKLRYFIQALESIGTTNFLLPSKVISRGEAGKETWVYPKNSTKRLEILIGEAREAITHAQRKDPSAAVVQKAWRNLLLAESYSACEISTLSPAIKDKGVMASMVSQYIQACERAWAAKKLLVEFNPS